MTLLLARDLVKSTPKPQRRKTRGNLTDSREEKKLVASVGGKKKERNSNTQSTKKKTKTEKEKKKRKTSLPRKKRHQPATKITKPSGIVVFLALPKCERGDPTHARKHAHQEKP